MNREQELERLERNVTVAEDAEITAKEYLLRAEIQQKKALSALDAMLEKSKKD